MIPTYLDHIPEGTSTRTFTHYAQLFLSGIHTRENKSVPMVRYNWLKSKEVYFYGTLQKCKLIYNSFFFNSFQERFSEAYTNPN